jgi:hypothetical protein
MSGELFKTLGLCFSANHLYYAVHNPEQSARLEHVGCYDLNFNVARAIRTQSDDYFPAIYEMLGRLKRDHQFRHMRMCTVPDHECWTTLPKLVYDEPDEREAHLRILMNGVNRQSLETVWYDLSNRDFKFLVIRNKMIMDGFQRLTEHAHTADFVSDHEIGQSWIQHAQHNGSFMMIHSVPGMISVSAYMLGKLRGATYLQYEEPEDLPYLWLMNARNLSWMNGFYDQTYVFGTQVKQISQTLKGVWDHHTDINTFETLENMQVGADEKTYSFSLESAFPAILLSLNL